MIQSVLEMLEIPYTHSGIMTSAVAMDKPMTKRLAMTLGVQSPEGVVAHKNDILASKALNPPYVVKPTAEGSSCGVTIIRENDNKCAVLDGQGQDVTEIQSHTDFFDYEAKYQDDRTEYVLPANIPEGVRATIMDWSERVYLALGCSGLARCDYVYDERIDDPAAAVYFLEINTQPGLTPESIGPRQVIHHGMSFTDLCRHLVETAKCHESQPQEPDAATSAPVANADAA